MNKKNEYEELNNKSKDERNERNKIGISHLNDFYQIFIDYL